MDPICAPCVTRQPAPHVYYGTTKSLCATCRRALDAKVQFENDRVYFDKYCPEHGHQRKMISSSVGWYLDAMSFLAPSTPPEGALKPVRAGCPFDCGLCVAHLQKVEPARRNAVIGLGDIGARFDRLLADDSATTLEIELDGASPGIPEVHELLRAHTGGQLVATDFVPSPHAHPHCFSMAYLRMNDDGSYTPFTRVLGRERTFDLLVDGELGDQRFKAVHVHAHMDEDTFDVARVMRCSVGTERSDGSVVPRCADAVVGSMEIENTPEKERRALPIVR